MTDEVLLVGPLPPPYYGQSVSFRMLVDEVERRGVPHRVVDLAQGEKSGEKIGTVTLHRLAEYAGILARFFRAAAGGGKTVYLTIAQSRHGFLRDRVMIGFARARGHRVVVHLKGGNYGNFYAAQPPRLQRAIRSTLLKADRVLVLGERLRAMFDFEPRLAGRIHVVANGLPDDREPSTAGKRLPAPGEGPARILYLSNLVESKGFLDVLEAVRLLRDRLGPGRARCDFYGQFLANPADDVRVRSGEHARELFEGFVREHGLEGEVAWHGVVSGDAKREVLERSHFFVLPTAYNNEGQPVSIIEAMAHGNVVISTDYRAIPDLVEDGVSGRLVPYGRPEAIADAVAEAVETPGRFEEMSRAAVARFRGHFTREAHLERLLAHILPGAPAPAPRPGAARAAAESA